MLIVLVGLAAAVLVVALLVHKIGLLAIILGVAIAVIGIHLGEVVASTLGGKRVHRLAIATRSRPGTGIVASHHSSHDDTRRKKVRQHARGPRRLARPGPAGLAGNGAWSPTPAR